MSQDAGPSAVPSLSVIAITPDTYATLRPIIRCLSRQTVRGQLEIVFVAPSVEGLGLDETDVRSFTAHRVVAIGEFVSTSVARAAGVRAASAPLVVFAEDHCFPAPGWAEALIAAHEGPWAGVGPAVRNANPSSLMSWANLLIEYGPWLDPARGGEHSHIPGHNSSYKRDVLLRYEDRLADWLEAESVLQWHLRSQGCRLALEPRATVSHQNVTRLGGSVALRFHGGRLFAANRARHWSIARRAVYACASPLIPVVRFARTLRHATRVMSWARLPHALMPLAGLLVCDGFGELVGYATGAGDAMRRLTDMEFHRHRYVGPRDRLAIDEHA